MKIVRFLAGGTEHLGSLHDDGRVPADNPFVKGEGLSPKARRELLGHSQLSLSL